MSVDERQRYHLHQTLETTLGSDAAATLMTLLPPVGWADVATKHDLVVLRSDFDALEQRLGLRISAEIAEVRTEIHRSVRAMTFTFVGATAAIVTVIATITSLFG